MNRGAIQEKIHRGESPFKTYRRTVVGETGFLYFMLYEMYTTLVSPLPGTPGIILRSLTAPFLFASFGQGIRLQQDVTFRRPQQIRLGHNVVLEKGVILDVKSRAGRIEIHDDVHIGHNTILSCPGGTMLVGTGSSIGSHCRLGSLCGLAIGSHCTIGDATCIVGAGHAYEDLETPIIDQELTCKGPCSIGNNVTIGEEATVLDGVRIDDHVCVANGSLVNKNIRT